METGPSLSGIIRNELWGLVGVFGRFNYGLSSLNNTAQRELSYEY